MKSKGSKFILWFTFLFVTACGAKHPLQRGKDFDGSFQNPFHAPKPPGLDNPTAPTNPEDPNTPAPDASEVAFNLEVLPRLEARCASCHENPAPDYPTALNLVTPGNPDTSALYSRATGTRHRSIWKKDSEEATILANWIRNLPH